MSSSSLASSTSDAASLAVSSCYKENLSFDKCPGCKTQFDFLRRATVTRVPLILACKHTVCEDCIRRMCLTNNPICPVCKEKFTVTRAELDSLTDVFQPHFTLIGQLVWMKNNSAKKQINWGSARQTFGGSQHFHNGETLDFRFEPEVKVESSEDDFEKTPLSFVFDKCGEHGDQYANIECSDCKTTCCGYCFIENHSGHKATSLYKLTEEENAQLHKFKADIEVVCSELLKTRKKMQELKTSDTSSLECDISCYFTELHAKLHFAERNIRMKLSDLQIEEADVDGVNTTVKSSIYRVLQIIKHFDMLNDKKLNVKGLFQEIQAMRNIPCRLISDQGSLRPIEFVYDHAFDDLEDYVSIRATQPAEYSLAPIEDWSQAHEKYEVEQIKRSSEHRLSLEPSEATGSFKIIKHAENKTKKANEGLIRVVMTHINSLNSFFVQKHNNLHNLKEMNNNISKRSRRRAGMEEFKLGGTYGVSYEARQANSWRRGRILDITATENGGYVYKVYFVDYGNTQMVTRDKLKELDIQTVRRQPFAMECKLTNSENLKFDVNAHVHLLQKELYMRFVDTHNNRNSVHQVDLVVATSDGGLVAVRDLLTQNANVVPEPKVPILTPTLKLFKNSKQFSIGQEERVLVTFIKDPFYICVQLAENAKILQKTKDEMEKFYKNQPIISSVPVVNTDVIVKYEDEDQGSWHRAKVTAVNIATKQVVVYFVDWGKSTTVPWSSIRSLTENFIKVECQGIIVRLAHIEMLGSSWSPEATKLLREQIVSNQECRMVVSNVETMEVALFQLGASADLCLNSLLTQQKYALSTGKISETVFWPNDINPEVGEADDDLAFQMVKKSEEIIVENDDDPNLNMELKQVQVSVLNFENPYLIYIKFAKYKEEDEQLHKELQIHYSSNRKNKNTWNLGEKCVIFDKMRNSYFRAVIKSQLENNNHVVTLFDHSRDLKVNKKWIFPLNRYFAKFPCYVCKCRLSNVRPAGDPEKWSYLAVEMLQKIFSTYKTFYVKKQEIHCVDRMLGVIMWYCLTTPAKALEPAKLKFISINQSLIEGGVAFSMPSSITATGCANGKPDDDEDLIFNPDKMLESGEDFPDTKSKTKNWFDMVCEDEKNSQQIEEVIQDEWKAPFKFKKTEFDATLTCVDNRGYFCVRDEAVQTLYLDVQKSMNFTFNSMPNPVEEPKWRAGDMCTIKYDDEWYRGTVIKVINDEEISVEMIDFGSEHVIPIKSLTKAIMFPDFPRLVNKVRLYDVHSKYEDWLAEDVDKLLKIVTDKVKVVIKGDLTLDVPFAEVYLDTGLSVNDLITVKCPHITRHENKVALGGEDYATDSEEEKNENPDLHKIQYNFVNVPRSSREIQNMFVVNVLKWDVSYNVVLSTNEDNISSKEFITLNEVIQRQVNEQTVLEQVDVSVPCVCLHPHKNLWSRAIVYDVDMLKYGSVLAFFVDYGTLEMVSVKGLKQVKCEWLELPVYLHIAYINIELLKINQAEMVLMKLNNLRNKYVSVEVVAETPLTVHLYEGKNLYYKDFVDYGIIKAL